MIELIQPNSIKFRKISLFLIFIVLSLPNALAQTDTSLQSDSSDEVELKDKLGRDTPQGSFRGFLEATEEFDYATAAKFLDLRNLPHASRQFSGEELARQLDFVLQRGMKIDLEHLSKKVAGQVVDDLPEYRDELGPIFTDEGELTLLLQRVPGENDNQIWKVSNASIAKIPGLFNYFSYPDWVESIRAELPADISFLGVELFKWVIVIGAALLLAPIFWLIGFAISWFISKPGSPLHIPIRKLFTRPLNFLAITMIVGILLRELGLGATAQAILEAKTLVTIIVVWVAFSLIDLARAKRRETFIAQGRSDAHILGRPMANALKLFTLLIAILVWLSNSGLDITTLLAGLGVGGVALALALQKPIEDLLGAISLYSQQPIHTGDLCKFGNTFGSVEEIGLRTTRIRTLENTLVSIPNCIIAHGTIENFSARKEMLYHPSLPLRYDTSTQKMQTIIGAIEKMAAAHPKVLADTVRVRFTEFTDNAMIIKARIYIDESDFSSYLKVVGELNIGIMQAVQEAGGHFSQGATTVMLEQGSQIPSNPS